MEDDRENPKSRRTLERRRSSRPLRVLSQQSSRMDIRTGQETLQEDRTIQEVEAPIEAQPQWAKIANRLNFSKKPQQNLSERSHHYRIESHGYDNRWSVAKVIARFSVWSLRGSFRMTIAAVSLAYLTWIIFFAGIIFGFGRFKPQCVGGTDGNLITFVDAYHLSWTTLSTVGYGLIGPEVPTEERMCLGINFFMALESFVGVLFASVTASIVFLKIARTQSIAHVRFSYPICVRYDTGVGEAKKMATSSMSLDDKIPLPVLEFRILNELANNADGEIVDAQVNVIACVLDKHVEAEEMLSTRAKGKKKKRNSKKDPATKTLLTAGRKEPGGGVIQNINKRLLQSVAVKKQLTTSDNTDPYNGKEQEEIDLEEANKAKEEEAMRVGGATLKEAVQTTVAVDEGNHTLAPPRKYHKIDVETDRHPFFKRSWMIRHVLDQNSPLLSLSARRAIIENGGSLPPSLNSYEAIRSHLRFTEIIVSFSGTANDSGSSVYAHHSYTFDTVNIGYAFANVLSSDEDRVLLDASLFNDIKEQKGGGAEPLLALTEQEPGADDVCDSDYYQPAVLVDSVPDAHGVPTGFTETLSNIKESDEDEQDSGLTVSSDGTPGAVRYSSETMV